MNQSLFDRMTFLWAAHVTWTRQVIVSTLAGLADADTALTRLLHNQYEIGSALGQYYGDSFGALITRLLIAHIEISTKLVKAAASGNSIEASRQDSLWHANATEIANAFASVSTYWQQSSVQSMLFEHLRLTHAEVVARIQKNWTADVQAFDHVLSQALMMGKIFATGISAQFGP